MTQTCQNCKKEFVFEIEDLQFYERIKVPPPTWCPECRLIRKMLWRNERVLYKRKCDKTGREIFSMYSSNTPFIIWDHSEWIDDSWNQYQNGLDYDFNKPFFEQFYNLLKNTPLPNRSILNLFNSDYCNHGADLNNCYLVFGSTRLENCLYSSNCTRCKECIDCDFLLDSELCYECLFNQHCYNAKYSVYCENCVDISFCKECIGCNNCFGCVGLRNKSYYIFNQPYDKNTFYDKLKELEMKLGSLEGIDFILKQIKILWMSYPVRYSRNRYNKECIGEYITNSKNVKQSYYVNGGEDLKYCYFLYAKPARDSYDHFRYGENSELIYDCGACGHGVSQLKFCYQCYSDCRNIQYSYYCRSSKNLFGCISLHNAEYCILNKQYTKEEYEELVPKIIKHMNDMPYIDKKGRVYKYGEFFPPELSPFCYNETIAQEYFPKTKEQALQEGYSWKEPEEKNIIPDIKTQDLPDHIKDVDDSIIGKIIQCAHTKINQDNTLEPTCNEMCTRGFKIIKQELDFYKRMNLPIPRLCPNCRHFQRLKQRNPLKLWKRTCQCQGNYGKNPNNPNTYQNQTIHFHGNSPCPNEFQTSYSPDRPEIVYCEECYNQEVV